MKRKCFNEMACPIARSLEKVGEWWSILILRDAALGKTRFDEFQKSLGIGSNTLTRRLNWLVAQGLLERRGCGDRPSRHEYVLTASGREFQPVLQAFLAWGRKHAPALEEAPRSGTAEPSR
jgi:DNA-binding HxlR family transcriptional regulator